MSQQNFRGTHAEELWATFNRGSLLGGMGRNRFRTAELIRRVSFQPQRHQGTKTMEGLRPKWNFGKLE